MADGLTNGLSSEPETEAGGLNRIERRLEIKTPPERWLHRCALERSRKVLGIKSVADTVQSTLVILLWSLV
ncbi:hypothetical protein N7474_001838 [Penicillium riverlandense]|uniref:uncharacterized protein n=1 Tax=Penicillium riverlandense TaxID=1903569 RepID=UPI00254693A6|nr:uncharacterized protein N7474_001838 [Penicillium riverlandense]KAJ5833527.1 hypothetical protein N7474_001838 [Penicillium riverlandense]